MIGEQLVCKREASNAKDACAVAVIQSWDHNRWPLCVVQQLTSLVPSPTPSFPSLLSTVKRGTGRHPTRAWLWLLITSTAAYDGACCSAGIYIIGHKNVSTSDEAITNSLTRRMQGIVGLA